MSLFGDKKRKSWAQLTFARQQTKAGQLAREQARSHRVARVSITLIFAVGVSLLLAFEDGSARDWQRFSTLFGVVVLVHGVMFALVRAYHPRVLDSVRRFAQFFILSGAFLLVAKGLNHWAEIQPFLIPLPVLAVPLALIYGGPLAIHASLSIAILLGVMVGMGSGGTHSLNLWESGSQLAIAVAATQFLGSMVAVLGSARIRTRTKIFTVGVASGFTQCLAIIIFQLWNHQWSAQPIPWEDMSALQTHLGEFLKAPLWGGFFNGLISGVIITSALPFLERMFEVTTDMRLIELADQNRPLLRQFSLVAPGSFHHSLMVGQLAEEAAQSIGANDLLARVGALYHDIGKMMKPNYFVENMRDGENVHDRLSPEMSRLIIVSHVKDGIRIAQEEGLPKPIIDMIPMHHGTSVVEYFYRKKRQQEVEEGRSESGEEAFSYPGPRPTFREAGILMLADTTEAISRLQNDPTPARMRALVRDVIQKKMAAHQLDECELTMHDLSRIEDAFVRVLVGIHHGRVKYPTDDGEPEAKSKAEGKGSPDPTKGGAPETREEGSSDSGKSEERASEGDAKEGERRDGGASEANGSGGSQQGKRSKAASRNPAQRDRNANEESSIPQKAPTDAKKEASSENVPPTDSTDGPFVASVADPGGGSDR